MSNILTNNINPRSGNLITIGGANDRVSIVGTLSYEDVTNIDSVGIITAQSGIRVPGGRIGIGTDNPQRLLHVVDAVTDTLALFHSGDTDSQINFQDSSSTSNGISIGCRGENFYVRTGLSTERMRIDSSGRLLVGVSSATGPATLQVQTPTTLSTTLDTGVSLTNTSTKTYPTTSSFRVTAGLSQNIELGTSQTVNSSTPGGFNYVSGDVRAYTKSAGTTSDIDRLNFAGFNQSFTWADANTCKQYQGFQDNFFYSGINANGRTSSAFSADGLFLNPPDGGTQTVANATGKTIIRCWGKGTSTVNITNSTAPIFRIFNLDAGTKTVNITNHKFFSTSTFWGVVGGGGTLNATITNLYGLHLTAPSSSTGLTVTNNWGIRQEWSSAKNWFAGASNQFPNVTTTASGANAFLDSGNSNRLYRSTSSIVYKKDIEDLETNYADRILNLRSVWYRSKCETDRSDWSWYGFIAEEVAAIDPRLVHYGYQEDAYESVSVTETVDISSDDPRHKEGLETEEVTREEIKLKDDAEKVPDGIAYDRFVVPLLDIIKRQQAAIETLEQRLTDAGIA